MSQPTFTFAINCVVFTNIEGPSPLALNCAFQGILTSELYFSLLWSIYGVNFLSFGTKTVEESTEVGSNLKAIYVGNNLKAICV